MDYRTLDIIRLNAKNRVMRMLGQYYKMMLGERMYMLLSAMQDIEQMNRPAMMQVDEGIRVREGEEYATGRENDLSSTQW